MRRFLIFLLPLAAYAALIFYLSSQPSLPRLPATQVDKVIHLVEYGVFGALAARALGAYGAGISGKVWGGLLLGSVYGATDEVHQRFTPHRSADPADWLADTLGSALGALVFVEITRRQEKKR